MSILKQAAKAAREDPNIPKKRKRPKAADQESLRDVFEAVMEDAGQSHHGKRYENLEAAGAGLRSQGGFLKFIGIALAVVGLGAALFLASGAWSVLVGVLSVAAGAGLYGLGVFVAGAGEAMFAVKDTAVNTGIVAEAHIAQLRRKSG